MVDALTITRVLNSTRGRVALGRGAIARVRPELDVGTRVRIGRGVRWRLEPGAAVVLGDGCEIDDGATIAAARGATLRLGDRVFIGHHATIAARSAVDLGAGTFCGELVSIRDHDHDPDLPPSSGVSRTTPVLIGRDCWLAAKVTVTRGVTIGDRVVIGANAVVTRDLPDDIIAVGVPASRVQHRDRQHSGATTTPAPGPPFGGGELKGADREVADGPTPY